MMKRVLLIACMLTMGINLAEAKRNKEPKAEIAIAADSTKLQINVVDPMELRNGVSIYDEPEDRRRRVDREINKRLFIQKGETMLGLSGSYYNIDSKDAELFLVLDGITAEGSAYSVKPFAGYFYHDNRAVGGRFTYSGYSATIDAATLDLGESNDISFDIPYINLSNRGYSYSAFHRSYAALDNHGHFGVFAEIELSAAYSNTDYEYMSGDVLKSVYSKNQSYAISFNPGISAFIYNNVCASLSFEFGGLHYTNIKQYDADGELVGQRDASKMQFMFNVFAINFGMTIHLWK